MTYLVSVEPADEHRKSFAQWCLAQHPPILTASSTGSQVPVDLFPSIPDELLHGAYIDGHLFRPVIAGRAPSGEGYRDELEAGTEPVVEEPVSVKTTQRRRNTRKDDNK